MGGGLMAKKRRKRDRIPGRSRDAVPSEGTLSQTLAEIDRVIELAPEVGLLFAVRGEIFRRMERNDQALADFDRAIELDPAEDEFAAARTEICQLTRRSDTDDG